MPVAIASGVTEIEWPNDIEATVLGDARFLASSGCADGSDSRNALRDAGRCDVDRAHGLTDAMP